LQAGQESPDKAAKLREESLTAYRSAIKQIETIRAGSLRADESRSTFLATTKDVYDEAAARSPKWRCSILRPAQQAETRPLGRVHLSPARRLITR